MSSGRVVADTFRRLTEERAAGRTRDWTPAERGLWQIVSAACQKDMGGLGSVFTDCSSVDFDSLVISLRIIDEAELAEAWAHACASLESSGVLQNGKWSGEEPDARVLDELEGAIGDRMWGLDDKLAAWLSR